MNKEHSTFSLIADFDGDISTLFSKPVAETLPILPLRNMVLFPGVVAPVTVGRESSLKLIRQAEKNGGRKHQHREYHTAHSTKQCQRIVRPGE